MKYNVLEKRWYIMIGYDLNNCNGEPAILHELYDAQKVREEQIARELTKLENDYIVRRTELIRDLENVRS